MVSFYRLWTTPSSFSSLHTRASLAFRVLFFSHFTVTGRLFQSFVLRFGPWHRLGGETSSPRAGRAQTDWGWLGWLGPVLGATNLPGVGGKARLGRLLGIVTTSRCNGARHGVCVGGWVVGGHKEWNNILRQDRFMSN